jgi:uncharacterized membrane protein
VALLASLALNALFVGGLASALFRHGSEPGRQPVRQNLGAYVSTLPRDRSDAILKRAEERRRTFNPLRRDARQARDAALVALTAEPFDREKFIAAETKLIEAENALRLAQRDVLADIAGSLTAEERRTYVRWRTPPPPIQKQ